MTDKEQTISISIDEYERLISDRARLDRENEAYMQIVSLALPGFIEAELAAAAVDSDEVALMKKTNLTIARDYLDGWLKSKNSHDLGQMAWHIQDAMKENK